MGMEWRRIATLSILLICAMVTGVAVSGSENTDPEFDLAPLSPAYLRYIEQVESGVQPVRVEPGNEALGHVPPEMDWWDRTISPSSSYASPFDPSFDLRTAGQVTSVKNQGACGCCWAFATVASLESDMLVLHSQTLDLSENNLKECHGCSYGGCAGGNASIAAGYLARRAGPVAESADPYVAGDVSCTGGLPRQCDVNEIHFVPDDPVAHSLVKLLLINWGAMYVAYYWDPAYNNDSTHAYYYNGTADPNHSVAIIGWDDNFAASNFKYTPPGNGAWLVKNSWGTSHYCCDSGYFWLSYHDTYNLEEATFFTCEPLGALSNLTYYEYDPFGSNGHVGYPPETTAWGANVFTAIKTGYLHRVQFFTTDFSTHCTIYVRRGGPNGTTVCTETQYPTFPGFHTVDLSTPVQLSSGELFSVVIKFENDAFTYPVPLERPSPTRPAVTAGSGQSYISYNGVTWSDVTTVVPNANVCIKAGVWPATLASTEATFRVGDNGDVLADRTFHGKSFLVGAADLAEWVYTSESVGAGDVLELDPENPGQYRRARAGCTSLVAGVVSTNPGVILGAGDAADRALLALAGIVPVKACDEGGPIQVGDLVVPASVPGHVRKWNGAEDSSCPLVGKALTLLVGRIGEILILLTR